MNSEWEFVERIESKIQLRNRWYKLILHLIRPIALKMGSLKTRSILEVGCGVGGFCHFLNRKFKNVVGLDIAKLRIYSAHQLGKGPNFIIADAQYLPFKSECFDMVVCAETLEHVPDHIKSLSEMIRVIRKGGYIVITVPNYINMTLLYKPLEFILRKTRRVTFQPADIHLFNIYTIHRLLKRKNLKIVSKKGIGLVSFHQLIPQLRSIEYRLDKPQDKLTSICINLGFIAQKIF